MCVGRDGGGSNLQSPMPYPIEWERTSALPQSPSSCCSMPVCPSTELVPGPPAPPQCSSAQCCLHGLVRCPMVGVRVVGQNQEPGLGLLLAPLELGLD